MANQIVVSAGAKVRNLQDVIIGTSGVLTSLGFDVANGVPRLDVNGKILVSQLPNSVMEYKGTWNAATNTPTLVNGTGNQGDVYLCNVAGTVDFGAGAIAFVVGDQVIYSGSIWQRASGATGTVTSVAITESGDSLNITGSPITTSGTINIGFNGTNLQYVNGAGNLTTFPTLITSIGLSMPSAFSVANSPLTANGTIAVTGAGVASQYIRGDGTLADFPSSGGGGSSVSYYLNGGTSQGTIGGTTYYEMSKTAVVGTGVDFAKTGDGFIVAFLTDANDPAQLNIPAGNWNYEIYASMSSNGGTPQLYAELYVYDGTTFTLISTSSNEIIYDGTALNLYTFAMAVPDTSLTLTDRLAVKLYSTNSGGKTTTIHTQDGHLCQIITTFSTGITALNGLTAQVQYFQTGTSGSDFNISSTTATHTFNIPDASATARGLITTGTQTIAGTKTFNDATKNNGGIFLQNASSNSLAGYMNLGGLTNGVKFTSGGGISNSFTLPSATGYTFTFPNANGTVALTSDLTGYLTAVTATSPLSSSGGTTPNITIAQATTSTNGYLSSTDWNTFNLKQPQLNGTGFVKATGTTISYDNSTYALDSAVVHNTGTETIGGAKTFSTFTKFDGGVILKNNVSASLAGYVGLSAYSASGNKGINIDFDTYSNSFYFSGTLPYQYTFPAATGTIALVGGSGVGTVTSVAALTIGTSGTDLSSTVANSTTTPVITLNVPTASATNRGALSSADWTTFNNKQSALTNPVTGTGTTNYLPKFTGASTIGNSILYEAFSGVVVGGPIYAQDGTSTSASIRFFNANSGLYNAASDALGFITSGTSKMILSASGNLGLGVTPSLGWVQGKALEVGFVGSAIWGRYANEVHMTMNYYYSTSANARVYASTNAASDYEQYDGNHTWYSAPSGTAGTNVSLTPLMNLFSTGNLGIGVSGTDSGYKLDVNGTGRFSGALSGTSATFSSNISIGTTAASGGVLRLPNDNAIRWRNSSNTADLGLYLGSTNLFTFDAGIYVVAAATFLSSVTATSFFESSDSRLKTLIQDNYQTKGIASITPKLYTKNGKVELGYYAQDFVGILDSAVSKGSDDMLSLSYREVLVAKVYALEQRIKELENK